MAIIHVIGFESSDLDGQSFPSLRPDSIERIRQIEQTVQTIATWEGSTVERHKLMTALVLTDVPWLISVIKRLPWIPETALT